MPSNLKKWLLSYYRSINWAYSLHYAEYSTKFPRNTEISLVPSFTSTKDKATELHSIVQLTGQSPNLELKPRAESLYYFKNSTAKKYSKQMGIKLVSAWSGAKDLNETLENTQP